MNIPYIKVNPKPFWFEQLVKDKNLLDSDVVVVAVGNPTLNLKFNRLLKEIKCHNVIFCWNEAASIGGHSVALNLEKSCFECLYTSNKGFVFESCLSLVKTGQQIDKDITGCGGVFTPYSYLASSQTAVLAAQQCIEMLLTGKHSYAQSWKGNNISKLKVTKRYDTMPLKEEVELTKSVNCKVCCG